MVDTFSISLINNFVMRKKNVFYGFCKSAEPCLKKKVQSHALAMTYRLNNQKMFLPSSNPENSKVAPEKINPSKQIYQGVSRKII